MPIHFNPIKYRNAVRRFLPTNIDIGDINFIIAALLTNMSDTHDS